jgi:hypothetical protein
MTNPLSDRRGPCADCLTYCKNVGGVADCDGPAESYQTRYKCEGHPLGPVGNSCGWSGVLAGTDQRDPSCPRCGGWVVKSGGARLRRVK